jgi:hypothetical protein
MFSILNNELSGSESLDDYPSPIISGTIHLFTF